VHDLTAPILDPNHPDHESQRPAPFECEPRTRDTTLDPATPQDWRALQALGHQMLDDMFGYLEHVRERPVWQRIPDSTKAQLATPVPRAPQGAEAAYAEFKEHILPYPLGNIHPRFWSWVCGTGTAGGMLAEMLSATMNSNVHGGDHAAIYVEQQVLSWLKEAMGYPSDATGILVTGGTMANLLGLLVARNAKADWDIKTEGLSQGTRPLIVYASREAHSSIVKAMETLGLGSNNLRSIPTDGNFRIRLDALHAAITLDRAIGNVPICVVGNAGTVNTGAIDNLDALATLCHDEGLWFHVDGAFGATAAISPSLRPLLRGLERADSLAFDLHKWMFMPYDVGCVLIRWPGQHHRAFDYAAAYLDPHGRGITAGPMQFSRYGIDLSRGFRALKVWFSIKEHGLAKYQAMVEQHVAHARYLKSLVRATPALELLAPVSLNIVCFRFRGGLEDEATLNAVNKEIVLRLQEAGTAAPSSTIIDGRFAIRVAHTNHRSRYEDFALLVREVVRLGTEM
jgi:aromatic-L-amino-acid/L-tryptophan decarboxylase